VTEFLLTLPFHQRFDVLDGRMRVVYLAPLWLDWTVQSRFLVREPH
jgi:hypothetical protein